MGRPRGLRTPPRALPDRLTSAVALYPCHILLVHRDAEKQPAQRRYEEIAAANATGLPHICVVPVRMQEAWLLVDEGALRSAAGRPSGREPLDLPATRALEGLPDPKTLLFQALITASGEKGRRAKRFNPARAAHRLADLVDDWSPLRELAAFRRLESDILEALSAVDPRQP